MKAPCYSPTFTYTPSKEMSPDYLAKKFARIRKRMKEEAEAQKSKVQQIRKVK